MSSAESFVDGRVVLRAGDCLDVLATLEENSVDAVVTDPPYHLTTDKKGGTGIASLNPNSPAGRARISTGFMGKAWDGGDVAFRADTWARVLRVLKPGGHVVAFSGTRTYHRMVVAIEDAGFEVRDQLAWVYGSGFPKSLNLDGDFQGWGTALKPSWEPICLARKPLSEKTVAANARRWGTGALNIDETRIEGEGNKTFTREAGGRSREQYRTGTTIGTAIPSSLGRWPANLAHDGSEEVLAGFPESKGQQGDVRGTEKSRTEDDNTSCYGEYGRVPFAKRNDYGSAARFFYQAKANAKDRIGSKHPTVKPVALMRWLVRMVTPPGGTVLDPFAGTGTTGQAAVEEGFDALLIEREEEYRADIARRLSSFSDREAPMFAFV